MEKATIKQDVTAFPWNKKNDKTQGNVKSIIQGQISDTNIK